MAADLVNFSNIHLWLHVFLIKVQVTEAGRAAADPDSRAEAFKLRPALNHMSGICQTFFFLVILDPYIAFDTEAAIAPGS